uniref:Uncharacterized protein n=1 Tax=Pararge aegeria TaxID=116150 RepID=S4NZC6_9NEOP
MVPYPYAPHRTKLYRRKETKMLIQLYTNIQNYFYRCHSSVIIFHRQHIFADSVLHVIGAFAVSCFVIICKIYKVLLPYIYVMHPEHLANVY